jgi:transposase InsO family protein
VWTYDFIFDESIEGRPLKWFSVLDEKSRFNLALEVERRFQSRDVIAVLERLFEEYGAPDFIRCDNGPEFIARAIKKWLAARGVQTLYIEPGSPWENGYVESFHSTFRDELLDRELFGNLLEAKMLTVQFRDDYNHVRPHDSLADKTPAEYMNMEKTERTRDRRRGDLKEGKGRTTPLLTLTPGLS